MSYLSSSRPGLRLVHLYSNVGDEFWNGTTSTGGDRRKNECLGVHGIEQKCFAG